MSLVLTLSVAPTLITAEENTDRTILYVATDGKDSNDGSKANPFATIEHARDTIRQMKKDGKIGSKGAVVYLRDGTYSQTKTLEFTDEDSGTENAPIVYRSYPGEEAKIVGGASLPLKEMEKVTDEAVLSKLIDSNAKDNLYRIKFDKIGITDDTALLFLNQRYGVLGGAFGEVDPSLAHYGYELKEYFNLPKTRSSALKVMADDDDVEVARYPDSGYMYVDKAKTQYCARTVDGDVDFIASRFEEMLAGKETVFPSFVPKEADRVKLWSGRDLTNVILSGNLTYGWSTECMLLKEIQNDGTIVCAHATYYGDVGKNDPFYVYNFFDEISENEFYMDLKNKYMYICLPKAPTQYNEIKIALLEEPVFRIENASYININDINFSFSASQMMLIEDSRNVVVDNCEFSKTMDTTAVLIQGNSTNCGIQNSYFHNINGGVKINASNPEAGHRVDKANCFFVNNEVKDFSEINKTGTTALHVDGTGNYAMYNELHGADWTALGFGGRLNIIAFNEIYDVCKNTDDASAIYAGQSWVPRGCVLAYNYIHDLGKSSGGASLGVQGIYLDDGFSRADVVGNVLENIPNYGIFLGGGNGNGIYNNVIINSGGGIWCDERCVDKTSGAYTGRVSNYYQHGTFPAEVIALWPDLENMDFDQMRYPANIYKKNVMFNSGNIATTTLATKYGTFEDNWATTDNPGFADIANKDYTLDENSAAAKKIDGFLPIPFTRMGRCTDRATERIKPATVLAIDSPKALINGTEVTIDEDESIVPMVINDSTYLPLRFLAEANGFTVEYNTEDKTASFENDELTATVNIATGEVVINGEKASEAIDVVINNNRTYLPMRKLSEMLGKYVFWDKCGLIAVSNVENLFSNDNDAAIINYVHSLLDIY